MLKPAIATEAIALTVVAGQAVTLAHGMGRQIEGFIVIWRDAPCELYVQDAAKDSSKELVLVPTASANVRVVLL